MIRETNEKDREELDKMQFDLQEYFSEIDQTYESLPYRVFCYNGARNRI